MASTFLKNTISALFAMTLVASCQPPGMTTNANRGSKLSQVNVKLPASTAFKPTSGTASVDAFQLVVSPKDSSCVNATKINETKVYADGTLSQKFVKGCDYLVSVSLGEKASDGTFSSYYENSIKKEVSAKDLETSPVAIAIKLTLTDAGKTANMPDGIVDSVVPNPVPAPVPTSAPTPVVPSPAPVVPTLAPLPAALQGNITDSTGKEVSMESVFTTEYLVIDFSAPGCGYCVTHAREMNRDTQAQKIFSGDGKCKSITGIAGDSLDSWTSIVGKNTFVGKNSYGHKGNIYAFAKMFGLNSGFGTPTFLFVNRKGEILQRSEGASPDFDKSVEDKCR